MSNRVKIESFIPAESYAEAANVLFNSMRNRIDGLVSGNGLYEIHNADSVYTRHCRSVEVASAFNITETCAKVVAAGNQTTKTGYARTPDWMLTTEAESMIYQEHAFFINTIDKLSSKFADKVIELQETSNGKHFNVSPYWTDKQHAKEFLRGEAKRYYTGWFLTTMLNQLPAPYKSIAKQELSSLSGNVHTTLSLHAFHSVRRSAFVFFVNKMPLGASRYDERYVTPFSYVDMSNQTLMSIPSNSMYKIHCSGDLRLLSRLNCIEHHVQTMLSNNIPCETVPSDYRLRDAWQRKEEHFNQMNPGMSIDYDNPYNKAVRSVMRKAVRSGWVDNVIPYLRDTLQASSNAIELLDSSNWFRVYFDTGSYWSYTQAGRTERTNLMFRLNPAFNSQVKHAVNKYVMHLPVKRAFMNTLDIQSADNSLTEHFDLLDELVQATPANFSKLTASTVNRLIK